jgi:hypothetical protein
VKSKYLAVVVVALTACGGGETPTPAVPTKSEAVSPVQAKLTPPELAIPSYRLVTPKDVEPGYNPAIKINAVVTEEVTEAAVRLLLDKLYAEANAESLRRGGGNSRPRVFIYIYTSEEHFTAGMGQWVAMLNHDENYSPKVTVKSEYIVKASVTEPDVGGLDEETRRLIFRALIDAEDRAESEAVEKYPIPGRSEPGYTKESAQAALMNQGHRQRSLNDEYRSAVLARFKISEEQLEQISNEASEENWPLVGE